MAGSVNGKADAAVLVVAKKLELWSKVEAFKAKEEHENVKNLFANERIMVA